MRIGRSSSEIGASSHRRRRGIGGRRARTQAPTPTTGPARQHRQSISPHALRPQLHPHARPPLRLHRPAQPARLPRARDQRGDGLRPRRRRLLLLRGPGGRLAEPLVQRPHGAAGGELPRADRGGAGAAHLRRGRRRRLGGGPGRGRRRQPGAAAHRPLLPRPLRQLGPLPRPRGRPRRLRRRGRPPLRHRLRGAADDDRLENLDKARHSGHPAYPLAGHMFTASGAVDHEQLRAAIPAAIERAAKAMLEPSSASSPASARSSAWPRRPAAGPRRPRTGSGAPASATR